MDCDRRSGESEYRRAFTAALAESLELYREQQALHAFIEFVGAEVADLVAGCFVRLAADFDKARKELDDLVGTGIFATYDGDNDFRSDEPPN